jgi:peptidoglycan hydrolase FlgJ
MATPLALDPRVSTVASSAALATRANAGTTKAEKARTTAQNFEAVFISTAFNQMFAGVSGDGPLGGGKAVGMWRSFLTDEFAKSFAKSGGIGIADKVYRSLMQDQPPQPTQAARSI